ncbi:MAG: outer membrane lipoprotein-sorting protein [Candidatus Dadabacteria bacterium]|nr:outer membrane lipoprotein-sorting protein [Candidatus Dadabacteria bacterium]NIQ14857.1 outer membrane lipoprotein-sorting protein [Candidatus Dadabacteria bacterium]
MNYKNIILALLLIIIPNSTIFAENLEQKGKKIAIEAEKKDSGWGDNKSTSKMILKNKHGQESIRELSRNVLEVNEEGLGDKSIVVFDSPNDIKGTALLSHTKILKPDDQWLYLPAVKRVKRISSSNKSGPFVGSEFAYEDLLSQEIDKYNYKFIKEEKYGNLNCFVVERYPLYENSGYTKQVVWWDKLEYRPQKIDFYDRKDSLLKTLTYIDYKQYLGKYWRADKFKMVNHQNGKSTDLIFSSWEFGLGQKKNEFTPSRLKRAI